MELQCCNGFQLIDHTKLFSQVVIWIPISVSSVGGFFLLHMPPLRSVIVSTSPRPIWWQIPLFHFLDNEWNLNLFLHLCFSFHETCCTLLAIFLLGWLSFSHWCLKSFFLHIWGGVVCIFRAKPSAYGSSQARGWTGAAAVGLHYSPSNAMASEPHLQPAPQLSATPDPQPTEQVQGSTPYPHGYESGLLLLSHDGNSFSSYLG